MTLFRNAVGRALAAASLLAIPSVADAGNKDPNYGGFDKPAGSYKSTCNSEAYMPNMVAITAMCRKKSGSYVHAAIAYHLCFTGTIRNDDGELKCDRDPGTDAQDQAFRDAVTPTLDAASIIVFGEPTKQMYDIYMFNLRRDGSPYIAEIGERSLSFAHAVKFLRDQMIYGSKPSWDSVITRAFQQAKHRAPTSEEMAKYEGLITAGKAWYSTIVLAERAN